MKENPVELPPGLPPDEVKALQETILALVRVMAPGQSAHVYASFAAIWAAIVRLCWLAVAHALRQTAAQLGPGEAPAAPGLCVVRGPGLDRDLTNGCLWPCDPHPWGALCHSNTSPDPRIRPVGPLCLPPVEPQPPAIDWTAVTMPPPRVLLDTEGAIALLRGPAPLPPDERTALLLDGFKSARDVALADVGQLLDYLRARRDCPHDPGRLVFCSRCGKLATLRHAREPGRYLCDAHAQGLDPADLEGAAGCFQVGRVAALLEATDKSRGARIAAPYYGPPEGS